MGFNVGDKVTTSAEYDTKGTHLASFVRKNTYEIIENSGDTVVIGVNGVVTARVPTSSLTGIGQTKPTKTESVPPQQPPKDPPIDYAKVGAGVDQSLRDLLGRSSNDDVLRYSMRLFGVPHQFTRFCDYRAYASNPSSPEAVGRKFISTIFNDSPVVTFVPGKPVYLPGETDKQDVSSTLIASANGAISSLGKGKNDIEKKRYYGFQQDYIEYSKYANILCGSAAAFMDLDSETVCNSDHPLASYDWKDYRWTEPKFETSTGRAIRGVGSAIKGGVVELVKQISGVLEDFHIKNEKRKENKWTGNSTGGASVEGLYTPYDDDQKSVLDKIEELAAQTCFVQFYVDSNSSVSESASNNTSPSKIEGTFNTADEFAKELAFIANSGGLDTEAVKDITDNATDAFNNIVFGNQDGAIGGFLHRLSSSVSNVIQGDTMIFPEIYRDSRYSKDYQITVDLRTPYGNKYSYFLNVLVPLLHIMAFTIPKQTTANTYGSPFLLKAFYPGVFSCNMGIISSISINKCPDGTGWTVDGYPSHVRVNINLTDLYSDLTLTPSTDAKLFLANSSLIDYLAINSGVDLSTPQLKNRVKMITTAWEGAFNSIDDNVTQLISTSIDSMLWDFVSV